MIKAIIFDLDGTLIQTEVLKASSYAKAVHSLTNNEVSEQEVLDIFGKYVGLSRDKVLEGLANEFTDTLQKHLNSTDTTRIKELIINKRLAIYQEILQDSELLSQHFCPFTLGLLHKVYQDKFQIVLATMSHFKEANRIITMMGIKDKFDLVLTRDDVEQGKPNPEIYNKAKSQLGLNARECLIIEDSVNGIKAALNAEINVFAVTNDVTRSSVHSSNLLGTKFVIDTLESLTTKIYDFIAAER